MHDSVYEMTGDPRIAKALRRSLTALAEGPDGPLKEMAEGVLAGNIDLRQAASTEIYSEALDTATGDFLTRYEQWNTYERSELLRQTESRLNDLLEEDR